MDSDQDKLVWSPAGARTMEEGNLPEEAFDVRDHGNGWHSFSLTIGGGIRSFLVRLEQMGGRKVESVTLIDS